MNAELKPGMMALVIGAVSNPSSIGRIVEVCEQVPCTYSAAYGHGYFVKGVEPSIWALSKHLMPIKPEADPLHTKEEQHASA